jgi:DNA segregation ATPase FtsK/SpoIIIE, S-DNA-T family
VARRSGGFAVLADPSPSRSGRMDRRHLSLSRRTAGAVLLGWLGGSLVGLAVGVTRLIARYPRTAAAVLLGWLLVHRAGPIPVVLVLAAFVVGLLGWRLASPDSFRSHGRPMLRGGWRRLTRYGPRWRHLMSRHGLVLADGRLEVWPRLVRVRSTGWRDSLLVALRHGQGPAHIEAVTEELAHACRARDARVRSDRPGRVWIDLLVRDPLAAVIPALPIPADVAVVDLAGVPIGRAEDGSPWRLPLLGSHVLVAGATGSGKGSVVWSVLCALLPGIRAGLVQVWAVDPKGGMELDPGRPLFTRYEDASPEAMVELLEDAVAVLQRRARRLKDSGVRRLVPSVAKPFVLVVVDELAALTAYQPDRKLKSRADVAIQLLTSQGRAPGVCLLAALQDPAKEVLPYRNLFPVRVALWLDEPGQADMVLGAQARERGARCDQIPPGLPGVGYVKVDGVREPVRVRAGWVTDADITAMSTAVDADVAPVETDAFATVVAGLDTGPPATAAAGAPTPR